MTPISPHLPSAWRGGRALSGPLLSAAMIVTLLIVVLGAFLMALISADWKANSMSYLQIPRTVLERSR